MMLNLLLIHLNDEKKNIVFGWFLFVGDGKINVHTGNDTNLGDLLDHVLGTVQIDDTLMNTHLVAIPGLGTFTAWRFTGSDSKGLGWKANRALDVDFVIFCGAGEF